MKRKLTPKERRILELSLILAIALLSVLLWNTMWVYPVKLFVVLLHEISHAIAAIISGGSVIEISITESLGGQTVTMGGSPLVIASTGYLGSLMFGSALFISSYNRKASIWVCTIISALLILFAANYLVSSIGIIISILFAIYLYISPRYVNYTVHSYLVKTLGLISCLYVITDIKDDLLTLSYRLTDAQIVSEITGIPAVLWGMLWFAVSAVVIYYMVRFSYKNGLTK